MFSGSLSSQEKTERADDVLVRERVRKVRAFLVRLFENVATVIAENWQQLRQPQVVHRHSSLLAGIDTCPTTALGWSETASGRRRTDPRRIERSRQRVRGARDADGLSRSEDPLDGAVEHQHAVGVQKQLAPRAGIYRQHGEQPAAVHSTRIRRSTSPRSAAFCHARVRRAAGSPATTTILTPTSSSTSRRRLRAATSSTIPASASFLRSYGDRSSASTRTKAPTC